MAVLASVFTSAGGYSSPQAFVNGLIPAMWVGVAVLGAGALTVLALPFRTSAAADARITDVEVADLVGADVAGALGVAVAAAGAPAPTDRVLALAAGEAA